MNNAAFLAAYNEPRNGANEFYKHQFDPRFVYSDGVRDCAEAGLYWLLDILATEGVKQTRKARVALATVTLTVKGSKATLTLSGSGDVVFWTRKTQYTDAPVGVWSFLMADDVSRFSMILVSEY